MIEYRIKNKVTEHTEAIWLEGMTKEEYDLWRDCIMVIDRSGDGGGVLRRGAMFTDWADADIVICTENENPAHAMFGWLLFSDESEAFFDLKFFELVVIPHAREVGLWDVDRDIDKRLHPEYDWDRFWEIQDAISRAWPYPTLPSETI